MNLSNLEHCCFIFVIIHGFRVARKVVVVVVVVEFLCRVSEDLYGRILHQCAVRSGPQHSLQT